MTHIYEVIDKSNPESYYTLGIFPSFEEVSRAIKEKEESNGPISYATDLADSDREVIVIRRWIFGWGEPVELYRIEREKAYNDEYGWERI